MQTYLNRATNGTNGNGSEHPEQPALVIRKIDDPFLRAADPFLQQPAPKKRKNSRQARIHRHEGTYTNAEAEEAAAWFMKPDIEQAPPWMILEVEVPADWQPTSHRSSPPGTSQPFNARVASYECATRNLRRMREGHGAVQEWSIRIKKGAGFGVLTVLLPEPWQASNPWDHPPIGEEFRGPCQLVRNRLIRRNERIFPLGRWAIAARPLRADFTGGEALPKPEPEATTEATSKPETDSVPDWQEHAWKALKAMIRAVRAD